MCQNMSFYSLHYDSYDDIVLNKIVKIKKKNAAEQSANEA